MKEADGESWGLDIWRSVRKLSHFIAEGVIFIYVH